MLSPAPAMMELSNAPFQLGDIVRLTDESILPLQEQTAYRVVSVFPSEVSPTGWAISVMPHPGACGSCHRSFKIPPLGTPTNCYVKEVSDEGSSFG